MNNYVVIDIETSGINPDKDEIIRLSALKIVSGETTDEFSAFVKPRKPLSAEVERLTGITNKSLGQTVDKRRIARFFRIYRRLDARCA